MTVNNSIAIQDRMSPVLKTILSAMDSMISTMERVDSTSKRVGNADWSKLRSELSYANRQYDEITAEIERINNAQNGAKAGFGGWASMVTGLNQGFQLMRSLASGVQNVMERSDSLMLTNARLGMINDGLRTQRQLQDEVYAAAGRARARYEDIANLVSKVTQNAPGVFKDNTQAIGFAETFSKMLKASNAESSEISSATLQLTQALASGRLQGDEYKVISKASPMMNSLIAETMGVSIGRLKELASQGAITSDIIVRAMEQGVGKIDLLFAELPMSFGDRMTSISNIVGQRLNQIANSGAFDVINQKLQQLDMWLRSPEGQQAVYNLTVAFSFIANTIGFVVSGIAEFIGLVFSIPLEVFSTILLAVGAIGAAILITMIPSMIAAANAAWLQVPAHIATVKAVLMQAAAWAMAHAPVIILAAVIFGLLLLILKFPQVLGVIVGVVWTAVALIINCLSSIYNVFASLAEFIVNVFNHPLYSAKKLFVTFADSVLSIIKSLALAIDAVFGSSLASGLYSLQSKMHGWLGEMPDSYKVFAKMEQLDLAKEYQLASNKGTGWGQSMGGGLSGLKDKFFNFEGNESVIPGRDGGDDVNVSGGSLDSVGKVGGEVNIAKEDLKYLLDASTRQFVNRIRVEQVAPVDVNINVSGGAAQDDADRIADTLKHILTAQAAGATVTVGV